MSVVAEWKDDSECSSCETCAAEFNFFRRRHHCRRCGGIFCKKCSADKLRLPGYGDIPQRVCGRCRLAHAAILEVGKMRPRERRICILGCGGVGKLTLFQQMCEDRHSFETKQSFVGLNVARTRPMNFRGSEYIFRIVYAIGQLGYEMLQPQYTIGTHAYLLVFSVVDRNTFTALQTIRDEILACGGRERVMILIGNKFEEGSERQVSQEEGQSLARSWGVSYHELSVKKQRAVDELMTGLLLRKIVEWERHDLS